MSAHDAQPKPESIPPVVPAKVAYVAPTKAKGPPIGFDLQVPVHSVAPMHWKPQPQLPPRAQQEPQAKSTSGLLGKVGNPQPRWKAFPKEQNPGKAAKPPIKEPPHSCTSCTTHQQSVPVVMHWKPPPPLLQQSAAAADPNALQPGPLAKLTVDLLGKATKPPIKAPPLGSASGSGYWPQLSPLLPDLLGKATKPPIKAAPPGSASGSGYWPQSPPLLPQSPRMTHQQSVPVVMRRKPPPPLLQQSAAAADPNALQPGPLAKSTMDLLGKATKPPIKAPPPGSASGSGYWPQAPGSNLPMPTKPAPPLPPQHNAQAADPKTWQPEPTSQKEMLRLMDAFLSRHPPRVKAASAPQTAGQVPKAQAAAQTAGQVPFGQQTTSQAPLAQAAAQAAEQPPQPDDESVPGCQWTSFQMPQAQAAAQTAGQVPFAQQTTGQAPPAQAAGQAAEQPLPPLLPPPPRTPPSDDESVPGWPWTGPEPLEERTITFTGIGPAGTETAQWTWTRSVRRTWWTCSASGGWSWTDPSW